MTVIERSIIGLIPAAGRATRLGPIPCSKELLPIGTGHASSPDSAEHMLTAMDRSFEVLRDSGVQTAYVVIAPGKWDIPNYLSTSGHHDLSIAFVVVESSPNVPYSLDHAYQFVRGCDVALLFPDIVFEPRSALRDIIRYRQDTGVDVALALVPSQNGEKVDFVSATAGGEVQDIIAKPGRGLAGRTWTAATWGTEFTDFLHREVRSAAIKYETEPAVSELYVGDIFNQAIAAGLRIGSLFFENGESYDIGTLDELKSYWVAPR